MTRADRRPLALLLPAASAAAGCAKPSASMAGAPAPLPAIEPALTLVRGEATQDRGPRVAAHATARDAGDASVTLRLGACEEVAPFHWSGADARAANPRGG